MAPVITGTGVGFIVTGYVLIESHPLVLDAVIFIEPVPALFHLIFTIVSDDALTIEPPVICQVYEVPLSAGVLYWYVLRSHTVVGPVKTGTGV